MTRCDAADVVVKATKAAAMRVGGLLEDLVVEVGEAQSVASVTLELPHGPCVGLVDDGAQRQHVEHSREQCVILVCIIIITRIYSPKYVENETLEAIQRWSAICRV